MPPKKQGLGRGLSSLLGEEAIEAVDKERTDDVSRETKTPSDDSSTVVHTLRIIDVFPNPEQPRKTFDDEPLRALADSISKYGVLQPIAVRTVPGGDGYIIIAGERRWRAARLAGLTEVPVVIVDADERVAAELALIENLQREDLNAVEEAEGFKKLADAYNLSDAQIGELVGKSRPAVANAIRLLTLEKPVLDLLATGELSRGHARALITLAPTVQTTLAETVVRDELSVRQTELLVKKAVEAEKRLAEADEAPPAQQPPVTVDYYAELSENMSSKMTRKVKIERGTGKKGRGWVHIEYYSDDDLDYLAGAILGVRDRDW